MGLFAPPGHPTAACTCALYLQVCKATQVSRYRLALRIRSPVNWNWKCNRSCTSEVARVSRPLATIGQPLDVILEQSMEPRPEFGCINPNRQHLNLLAAVRTSHLVHLTGACAAGPPATLSF